MQRTGPQSGSPRAGWTRWMDQPYLLLVVTMLCWSGNWIFGRAVRDVVTPLGFSYMRWLLALLIFYPFAYRHLRDQHDLLVRHWKLLLVLGLLGVGLFHLLIYTALGFTTVINATLVNSAMPIAMVCITWIVDREMASRRQLVGILVSSLGVVVIVSRGDLSLLRTLQFNEGDLWALASVPVWGFYSVLLRRLPRDLHPSALLGCTMVIGVTVMAPFFLWQVATMPPPPPTVGMMVGVAYVAVFSSVVAYISWNRGVALVGANRAGQFVHLLPVFAAVLAVIFLGERPHVYHLGGVVLIFAGIYLATISGGRRAVNKA